MFSTIFKVRQLLAGYHNQCFFFQITANRLKVSNFKFSNPVCIFACQPCTTKIARYSEQVLLPLADIKK